LHTPTPLYLFFQHSATTAISTLSLHDALPIFLRLCWRRPAAAAGATAKLAPAQIDYSLGYLMFKPRYIKHGHLLVRHAEKLLRRSEEHTSELQSLAYLVCRLLLEKKKKKYNTT